MFQSIYGKKIVCNITKKQEPSSVSDVAIVFAIVFIRCEWIKTPYFAAQVHLPPLFCLYGELTSCGGMYGPWGARM